METITKIDITRGPRSYLLIDLELTVLDDVGHRRYRQMKRWTPTADDTSSRREYMRHEDPFKTPRWVFQTMVVASVILMIEHPDGSVDVARFETFSTPDYDGRSIIAEVLQMLADCARHRAGILGQGDARPSRPVVRGPSPQDDAAAGLALDEDRVLRRICALRPRRGYVSALQALRHRSFATQVKKAANEALALAPWLEQNAA